MSKFRSRVAEMARIGRAASGLLAGAPVVQVALENGESFVISPDENTASGWSVRHDFQVQISPRGKDIFVLYDEMPPKEVKFCGSHEAYMAFEETFSYR